MDNQKFCLRWNNFQRSLTSVFEHLRQDEELVDITLCCEGKKIKAHRMMLSACSPYFRDLLKDNPCQHPLFFLKDTSYVDMAAVVEFVYKGEVNVLQSQLASFLRTAETLQVRGLSGDDEAAEPSSATANQPCSGSSAALPTRSCPPQSPGWGCADRPSKRPRTSAHPLGVVADAAPPPVLLPQPAAANTPSPPAGPAVKREQLPPGEQQYTGRRPDQQCVPSRVHVKPEPGGADGARQEEEAPPAFPAPQEADLPLNRLADHEEAAPARHGVEGGGGGGATDEGGAQVWECAECGRRYRHRFSYQSHLKVHRGATTCRHCGRVYARVSILNEHLEVAHGVPRRRYNTSGSAALDGLMCDAAPSG